MSMKDESITTALDILKTRMNRLKSDTSLDETDLIPRLRAAEERLRENGIKLTDSIGDIVLLADFAAWSHKNRDSPEAMPKWLSLQRRERFLHTRGEKQ